MLKRRIALFILLGIINLFSSHSSYAQEKISSNYPSLIRPGVYAGNGRTLTYADYMLPLQTSPDKVYYMNVKTVFGHQGDTEQNVGLVYRKLSANEDVIWGVNGFYDTRFTLNNNYVRQAGVGFEQLTESVDFRANIYIPTTDTKQISESDVYSFGSTSVIKTTNQTFEEPLKGFDAEIGYLIPKLSDYVETRLFVGGYYYFSELSKDIPGWRLRLEASPSPVLTFELTVKDDRTIDTDYFAGAYVTLPFDMGNLFHGKNPFEGWRDYMKWGQGARSMRERMSDRIVRDIDVTAKNSSSATTTNAVGRLVYVDNTNGSGVENGTREHPYNTLTEGIGAVTDGAGDWVFVDSGDGTATGYTGNYTLKNSMTLWGEGYQAFPGLGGGSSPVLKATGGTGTILTAGTGNTIQGLRLQDATIGIRADDFVIVTIQNNIITAMTGLDGIGDGSGIFISSNNSTADAVIIRNNLVNFLSHDAFTNVYGLVIVSFDGTLSATVTGNNFSDVTGYGMILGVTDGNVSASFSRNTLKNNELGAAAFDSGAGSMILDFGGGMLGCIGYNSIFNNTAVDMLLIDAVVNAENNFWGGGAGTFSTLGSGSIDDSPFLTSDPN